MTDKDIEQHGVSRRSLLKTAGIAGAIGVVGLPAATGSAAAGIGDGRVAHYTMNNLHGRGRDKDEVHDASPYGNHGQWMTENDPIVEGRVGKALSFDGVGDYVNIPDSASLSPQDAITVALWVNTTEHGGGKVLLDKDRRSTGEPGYFLALDRGASSGKPRFLWEDTTGVRHSVVASTGVSDGTWHHLAATYDGSTMRIYVDGSEDGTNTVSFTGTDSGAPIELMRDTDYPSGGMTYVAGMLDEVRVYGRALASSEIQDLAAMGEE